jgi:two-component system, NarL family, sensor histidine kinase DesK
MLGPKRRPTDRLMHLVPEASDGTTEQATEGLARPASARPGLLHGGGEFEPSQRLARLILLTVLAGFAVIETVNVVGTPGPSHGRSVAVNFAAIIVLFALQLYVSSPAAMERPLPCRVAMLLAHALVTFLPLLVLGAQWGGMAGWLAGSMLLLIAGWAGWSLFAILILGVFIGSLALGVSLTSAAYITIASLDTGLIVFGLSRLSLIITYLKATRTELAQLAVVKERMRFARDLHDLLGYSLSAITLKAELTRRLVSSNPARARDELAELTDVARQALADVRLVASGYRNMSLSKEAASVLSLLSTAGIAARVEIKCGPLDEEADTVLATVLRETVTNMLRHSTAQNCTVEACATGDVVRLRVSNDGVPPAGASRRDGGGLDNLASRLAAVGGTLTVTCQDGRFEALATLCAEPGRVR